ncbi:MAG TPA: trypsin-like serine protease [Solirubrobacterales bacterium]|nr:trypsin-like serine protease [Solirubrobacterales bacterium]
MSSYQRDFQVGQQQAEEALTLQAQGTGVVEYLRQVLGEEYAGVWFDHRAGQFVVPITEGTAKAALVASLKDLGLQRGFRLQTVPSTWGQLAHAQQEVAANMANPARVATVIDPARNAVVVRTAPGASRSAREAIANYARKSFIRVEQEEVAASQMRVETHACDTEQSRACDKPLRGGVQIGPLIQINAIEQAHIHGACTAGFKATGNGSSYRYMLTAGHCFPGWMSETNKWASNASDGTIYEIGSVETYRYGAQGDWGKIRADGSWWADTTNWPSQVAHYWGNQSYPITYEAWPYTGQYLCFSGNKSGTSCGTVTNVQVAGLEAEEGVPLPPMIETNGICTERGDSGGPLYSYSSNTAIGMLTGSPEGAPPCSINYFTDITRATTDLGVTVGSRIGGPPSAATGQPTLVTGTQATVTGTVNPNYVETQYYFEYGTTTGYGALVPFQANGDAGHGGPVAVSAYLTGLKPGTTYHYRLVAKSRVGTHVGADVKFVTSSTGPSEEDDSSPGPRLLVDATKTLHVFYRDTSGNLRHRWLASGSESWGEETRPAEIASSSVLRVLTDATGTLHVFYRDASGKLGHHWLPSGSQSWSAVLHSASLSGDPRPLVDATKTLHVFYRNASGKLGHHWLPSGSESWSSVLESASLSGDPRPLVDATKTLHVFYRDASGKLGHRWLASGSESWGAILHSASLSGDPRPLVDATKTLHVFYRDASGKLGHHWLPSGSESWSSVLESASIASRPPIATTGEATQAGGTSANAEAVVDPEGSPTNYYIEYGPTVSYGSKAPISPKRVGHGVGAVALSEVLNGLAPATTYHYRVVATSPEGTSQGADKAFTTTASTATQLATMPVTEPFNGSAESQTNFNMKWSALGWASGTSPKGQSTTSGWGPSNAFSTLNGIYHHPTVTDGGSGTAAVATMAVNPGIAERHFSLWLDMQTPGGARSGYELRFTNTATNAYSVRLSKWVAGTETILGSKSGFSFVNGNAFALVDLGNTVSAWTNTGAGFTQQLSAADTAFSTGNAGLSGAGNITRLANFKAGQL